MYFFGIFFVKFVDFIKKPMYNIDCTSKLYKKYTFENLIILNELNLETGGKYYD